jgi:DNA end-binding protein Ku
MQAIWKGTVSFGLVSIPVRLYAATEEKGVSFRQVHDADGGRIRYKRVCSVDGEEVPYRDIVKGYELPDGDVIVLSDEDFAALPLATKRVIDVLEFVPLDQVDGIYLSKPYYLAAETAGTKPYVLLRDALAAAGRAALVKVALRNRESLALLRPKDGALLVQTMLWPDEVRSAEAFAPDEDVTVRDQEVAMARSYIETLSGDFEPGEFTDDYRVALEQLVEAKVQGREVTELPEPEVGGGTVVDLMAALRASVEAAQSRRSGGSITARAHSATHDASDDAEEPAGPVKKTSPRRKTAGAEGASADPERETPARKPRASSRKASADTSDHGDAAAAAGKPAAKATPAKRAVPKRAAKPAETAAGEGGADDEPAAPVRKTAAGSRARKSA